MEPRRLLSNVVLDPSFGQGGQVLPDEGDATVVAFGQDGGKIVAAGNDFFERYNADGTRDTSFGQDGIVHFHVTPYFTMIAAATAPGGKIVVLGRDAHLGTLGYAFALARFNSNGTLDTTFGSGGVVLAKPADYLSEHANALAIQSDGKILVAGDAPGNGTDMLVYRYQTSGALDPTFASNGKALIDFRALDSASSLAVRADGRILLGGYAWGGQIKQMAFAQLTPTGNLDPTFGAGGKEVLNDFGTQSSIANIALESDGSYLAAGPINISNSVLAHFRATRVLDHTFATGGLLELGAGSGQIVVQSDGKIVDFTTPQYASPNADRLLRFTSSGHPDTTFGQNGVVMLPPYLPGATTFAGVIATNSFDASIVTVFDVTYNQFSEFHAPQLFGYNDDGSPSDRFGSGGVVVPNLTGVYGGFLDVAALSNGDVVAAGWTLDVDQQNALYIDRYLPNGALDPSFGVEGQVITQVDGFDAATKLLVEPDGTLLVLAQNNYRSSGPNQITGILHLSASGNVINSFGPKGYLSLPNGTTRFVLQPDGKIVALSQSIDNSLIYHASVLRFNANGTVDTSFASGGSIVLIPEHRGFLALGGDLAMQGNNIVVTFPGGTGSDLSTTQMVVDRLTPAGVLDKSFGNSGTLLLPVDQASIEYMFVRVAADGSILIMDSAHTNSGNEEMQSASINANGSSAHTAVVGPGTPFDMALKPDGRAVFTYENALITPDGVPVGTAEIGRINPDGSLDPNFAPDPTTGLNMFTAGVAIAPNGAVVMCGENFISRPGLARVVPTAAANAPAASATNFFQPTAASALVISGTDASDQITVTQSGKFASVVVNGRNLGSFDTTVTNELHVVGLNGNDTIMLKQVTVPVLVLGGNGNDTIVNNGSSRATLLGGLGNDTITAGSGPTLLEGDGGDDVLIGGTGADTFLGGDGNDAIRPGTGPTNDIFGGAGLDTVDFSKRTQGLTIKLDGLRDSGRTGEKDLIGTDIERVLGSQGNDTIFGNAGAPGTKDALYGLGGNDTVYAGNGSDALYGGDGNDWLYSRNGIADYLDGGAGFNRAHIDPKLDTYVNIQMLLP